MNCQNYIAFLESVSEEYPELSGALLEGYQNIVLTEGIGKGIKGLLVAACLLTGCAGNAGAIKDRLDGGPEEYVSGMDVSAPVNAKSVRELATKVSKQIAREAETSNTFRDTDSWKTAVGIKKALEMSHPDDGTSGKQLAELFERALNQQNKIFGAPKCCRDETDEQFTERNLASSDEPAQTGYFDEETNTWVY